MDGERPAGLALAGRQWLELDNGAAVELQPFDPLRLSRCRHRAMVGEAELGPLEDEAEARLSLMLRLQLELVVEHGRDWRGVVDMSGAPLAFDRPALRALCLQHARAFVVLREHISAQLEAWAAEKKT